MPKLTIEIPDDLAARISAHPLALPLDDYCCRALYAAAERDAERRQTHESLAEVARAAAEHRLRAHGDDESELYTVPEAARILRLSAATIRRAIKEDKLPTTVVRGRQLISRRTITRVVDQLPSDNADLSGILASIRRASSRNV